MPFDLQPIRIPTRLLRETPRIDEHTQLLAIGDVHGCGRLLIAMMRAFQTASAALLPPARSREVVILGDFIDRGPNSLSVLRALYGSRNQDGMTVLLGNHEATLLACIDGRASPHDGWLDFGGDACLASLGLEPPGPWEPEEAFRNRLVAAIGENVVDWLRSRPLSYTVGDFLFCHAGVRPGVPLDAQKPEDLLWIREPFLHSRRNHGKVVVHGHSVDTDICLRHNRIGIDTGAYSTGRLTGLLLQGTQAWSLVVWLY